MLEGISKRNFDRSLERGVIGGYVEATFGEDVQEDLEKTPFKDLPEEEQLDKWYGFLDLIAERRLINRDDEKGEIQEKKAVRLGGLLVSIPTGEKLLHGQALKQERDRRKQETKEKIAEFGKIPGFREAYETKINHALLMAKAHKTREGMDQEMAVLEEEAKDVLRASGSQQGGEPRGSAKIRMEQIRKRQAELGDRIEKYNSYEAGHNNEIFAQLRRYSEAYENNMLIPVPTVERNLKWGEAELDRRQHIVFAGHLGSGKTEMAKHLARLIMLKNGFGGKEALTDPVEAYKNLQVEMFSGSYESSIYDLVGKLKLKVKNSLGVESALQELKKHEGLIAEYEEAHPEVKIDRSDLAAALAGKQEAVETYTELGPVARALEKGVPCIIDEFTSIRPEVLRRLNAIALARVGEKVRIQENGEEEYEIKPGFVLIFTCNLGAKYKNLQEVDAAFAGRVVSREVDYPDIEETYDLILTSLMNDDRQRLPSNFPMEEYPKLAALAVTAVEVQQIFSGKTEGRSFAGLASGTSVSAKKETLKGGVLSPRDLMRKIMGAWRGEGFKRTLDEVVADEFISSQIYEPGDRKFLTELFLRRGFFGDWTKDDLQQHGLSDLDQRELDTLRSTAVKDEYLQNDPLKEIWDKANNRGQALQRDLGIGVRKTDNPA
jgi:energy-coupling factor transporter ATP-binding protein EcfA2